MVCPSRARSNAVEETRASWAAVLWFKGIDAVWLNFFSLETTFKFNETNLNSQRIILLRPEHAIDQHSRNLARNLIICNPKTNLLARIIRQESQKIMIDAVQILPVLPRILQTF